VPGEHLAADTPALVHVANRGGVELSHQRVQQLEKRQALADRTSTAVRKQSGVRRLRGKVA
jgi:hypothetical protein